MNATAPFLVGGRPIGRAHPVYIVAELSANHHGRYDEAEALVRAAKEAGADAVKLQTYTPDTMTLDSDLDWFRIKGTIWDGEKLYELYRRAMTPWDWQPALKRLADSLGIHLFSTPFDSSAVDLLEAMGVPVYKVASFENGHIPLLRKIASTDKPVIVSTGMATVEEIDEALATLNGANSGPVALLKCTSAYPASPGDMNLTAIPRMVERFGVPIGLSDHTLGSTAAVAAVALGACIVEKHITLSREVPGPDSAFSTEPAEFRALVDAIRQTEQAMGRPDLGPTASEQVTRAFRRSLFFVRDLVDGQRISSEDIACIRPAHGLHPRHYDQVIGMTARGAIQRGTPVQWELLSGRPGSDAC